MNDKHQDNLKMYVNDVIGLERDIINAIEGQLEDDRITAISELTATLREAVGGAKSRIDRLKKLSEAEGGTFGAAIKEAATSVTGTLAGLYGKIREHPVSRMVRDDTIALNVTETSYTMLYTLALGVGHSGLADLALEGVKAAPPLILKLTDLLPGVVLSELAEDAPLANPAAESIVIAAVRDAWNR